MKATLFVTQDCNLACDYCYISKRAVSMDLSTARRVLDFIQVGDFGSGLFKSLVFGFIVGATACYYGINTVGGTEGVGRSATSSVVLSSLFIIVADVLLVQLIIEFF